MLTLDMVREAQEALRGIARRTPLDRAPKFGENVYIKAENLQLTGAFKLRGAYNKIRSLTPEEAARGVIACSAGNHAQGIALSASRLGIKAVICMPAGAPISKVEATRGYGAEVVLVPGVYDDAAAEAERLTKEQGYTFAHPFNDPLVIAGQGTIGLEILEQLPDVEQIVVPIGGGGLIGGIAFAVKQLKPDCRIVGVQAAGAASMYLSRHAGGPTELRSVSTIADGIAVKKPGDLTFALCQQYVDEVVTVSEDEIASAILALMEGQKTVAEGAGAVPVAAVMFGKVDTSEKKTVCVVSGGQRQAVALLMATMTPLKFLILDEHTAALDPKTAEVIMALTDRVIREKHLTAMMVTHNLRYAVEYGDRILMMNRGRVVLDRAGAEKRATSMDDILTMFNQISLETGN